MIWKSRLNLKDLQPSNKTNQRRDRRHQLQLCTKKLLSEMKTYVHQLKLKLRQARTQLIVFCDQAKCMKTDEKKINLKCTIVKGPKQRYELALAVSIDFGVVSKAHSQLIAIVMAIEVGDQPFRSYFVSTDGSKSTTSNAVEAGFNQSGKHAAPTTNDELMHSIFDCSGIYRRSRTNFLIIRLSSIRVARQTGQCENSETDVFGASNQSAAAVKHEE